ncbi:MAG: hypothetical protein SF182_24790 [Deltaproteobacteria bacterium]|nr:hypothetical protein [Deltaproteobacteria bacterium]
MMYAGRRRWWVALLAALLCLAACDDGAGGSPFRNLGKRGDSRVALPAPR